MDKPMKPESHWDRDRLARKESAEWLCSYLKSYCERAKEVGRGVSVNVNAPWGAGKTFFLAGMAETLEAQEHKVALVDTWRNDHADDPLYAVVAEILSALGKTEEGNTLRTRLKNQAGKIAITAGKGLLQKGTALVIGAGATDEISKAITDVATNAVNETISDYAASALERFEVGKKAIEDFRQTIAKELQGSPPLFVLVDELDRCRPTYAVLMLERIKHLFNVPNLVFVIATNTEQLAHTIRAVYGAGFDADHYLKRFFDRSLNFEVPNFDELIEDRWEATGLNKINWLGFEYQEPVESLSAIAILMRLEPRDIEQCLEVLWGVATSLSPEVPIPLLYLFSLVVLHHQAKGDEMATLFLPNGALSEDARERLPKDTFFFEQITGRREKVTLQANLYDLNLTFTDIMSRGLQDTISIEDPVSRYGRAYQIQEFSKLHENTYSHTPVRSLLADYPRLIRLAGRIS